MRYIYLKFRKGNPKYRFFTWDTLKMAGDFATLTLAILKLNG